MRGLVAGGDATRPSPSLCRTPDMGHQNAVSGRSAGEDVLEFLQHFSTALLAPSLAPSLAPLRIDFPVPTSYTTAKTESAESGEQEREQDPRSTSLQAQCV